MRRVIHLNVTVLEKISKHDIYYEKRINRGLFISKIRKAKNADLNGAINIMKKVINLEKIYGKWLYNPRLLNNISA